MTAFSVDGRAGDPAPGAVRHFGRAVGKTARMHRVSGRAEWRARAQREGAS